MVEKFRRIIVRISKHLPMLFGNWFKEIRKEGRVRLKDGMMKRSMQQLWSQHTERSQSQLHREFKASRGYKNPVSKINKKQWTKIYINMIDFIYIQDNNINLWINLKIFIFFENFSFAKLITKESKFVQSFCRQAPNCLRDTLVFKE